ncbi:Modification methylase DpnIIA [Apilactobacillus kunkeei]|nr:Modification methylase DpnIIA [Apilactobacillus kunkeei]CAI2554984.1 Modification methylase DpnIIA [Apilactobacillus kunkeei]CAI2555081.1 Modification methylase DpnIIA [Apilactobacillus kunkeei]CAI2555288.1 Modification methylase DpnIIA [Apilactobacillus kunkeei]CAI2555381.1 Modification methylase DpnIIA [Apilactobacillus kunkeei]
MTDLFYNENNLKPITKWVGGKRQLLGELNKFKPDTFNTYFEPFVGGGAFLFNLAPENAVINDFNADLVNLYKIVKNDPESLLKILGKHAENNSKDYYLRLRELDRSNAIDKLSDVEKAARILYMLKVDFNGLYRVNKQNQFNVPYGRYKNPNIADRENIISVSNYFNQSNVDILNGDFEKAVENAQKDDFVYFDPPYVPVNPTSDFTSYTSKGFNISDQERLMALFFSLSEKGVRVMLSNSDVDLVRKMYRNANIHSVQANRFINSKSDKRGKIGEVIITNY